MILTSFLHYSDDNKKDTFNSDGNNEHGLKTLRVNRPLLFIIIKKILFRSLGPEVLHALSNSLQVIFPRFIMVLLMVILSEFKGLHV